MKNILAEECISLDSKVTNMTEAINECGALLIANGYVCQAYVDDMFKKEEMYPSYIGNHVAIPHGFSHSVETILHSGVCVLTIPDGFIEVGGETVYIVIGIAGKEQEHMEVLSKIAIACSEIENIEKLRNTKTKQEVLRILNLD